MEKRGVKRQRSLLEQIAGDYARGLSGDFPVGSRARTRREQGERQLIAEGLQGTGEAMVGGRDCFICDDSDHRES